MYSELNSTQHDRSRLARWLHAIDIFEYENIPIAANHAGSSVASKCASITVFLLVLAYAVQTSAGFQENHTVVEQTRSTTPPPGTVFPTVCFGVFNNSEQRHGFLDPSIFSPLKFLYYVNATTTTVAYSVLTTVNNRSNVYCTNDSLPATSTANVGLVLNICAGVGCATVDEINLILPSLNALLMVDLDGVWEEAQLAVGILPVTLFFQTYIKLVQTITTPTSLRLTGKRADFSFEMSTITTFPFYTTEVFGASLVRCYVGLNSYMIVRTKTFQSIQDLIGSWAAFFGALCTASIVFRTWNKRRFLQENPGWRRIRTDFTAELSGDDLIAAYLRGDSSTRNLYHAA